MDQNNISVEPGSEEVEPQVQGRDRWRRIIEEHRGSGLGVAAFCRRKGIATSTFYGWRQKLNGSARPTLPKFDRHGSRAFVALKVTGAEPGAPAPSWASPAASVNESVEVCLGGGHRVLVREGFNPRLLQQVVRALEEPSAPSLSRFA
jgi:transposase-like protein